MFIGLVSLAKGYLALYPTGGAGILEARRSEAINDSRWWTVIGFGMFLIGAIRSLAKISWETTNGVFMGGAKGRDTSSMDRTTRRTSGAPHNADRKVRMQQPGETWL
jgi:hypothetical protein